MEAVKLPGQILYREKCQSHVCHLPFGPMRPTFASFPSSPGSPFSPSSPFEMKNEWN